MKRNTYRFLMTMMLGPILEVPVYASSTSVLVAVNANSSFDPSLERLRYAGADTKRFIEVMHTTGMVARDDIVHLDNPTLKGFSTALAQLSRQLQREQTKDGKDIKFVFYFSGHSDPKGFHLRDGFVSRTRFHSIMEKIPARTKIAILDSCFSGALRSKGLKQDAPVVLPEVDIDEPTGTVYLTSSSGKEYSYESKELKGSIFTHLLVSGLNGEADGNDDGIVTIDEIYQYSYSQSRSESFGAPRQSPEFSARMEGRGAVVMTYPAKFNATMRFEDALAGDITVSSKRGLRNFKIYKKSGEPKELLVPKGLYNVSLQNDQYLGTATVAVTRTEAVTVTSQEFDWQPLSVARSLAKKGFDKRPLAFTTSAGFHSGYAREQTGAAKIGLGLRSSTLWRYEGLHLQALGMISGQIHSVNSVDVERYEQYSLRVGPELTSTTCLLSINVQCSAALQVGQSMHSFRQKTPEEDRTSTLYGPSGTLTLGLGYQIPDSRAQVGIFAGYDMIALDSEEKTSKHRLTQSGKFFGVAFDY